MIKKINNIYDDKNTIQHKSLRQDKTNFRGNGLLRVFDSFIKSQENLSATRFIQGTATNWFPKAVLSRSKADFCEFTMMEFFESALFYFAAPVLGEHLFRKGLFNNLHKKDVGEQINKNISKDLKTIQKLGLDKITKNKLITSKAGIVLACIAVPAFEYALSFAKNLFTLKFFKISDFNNVANLNSDKKEDKIHQEKVEKHSKKELKKAGIISILGIASGILCASFGYKSNVAVKFSKILLEPGENISKLFHKVGIKSKKVDKFLKEYLTLDFKNKDGKLALSKGQLATTCITGLFGYSAAAKDRGKLDFYEVWTRVPLVVLYTIFGSSLLDGGFKKLLLRKGKCPDLIRKAQDGGILDVPTRRDLPEIAQKLAEKNKTTSAKELEKLIKQKAMITGVPYLFSVVAMGFILSGVTRLWTQFRYNKSKKIQFEDSSSKDRSNFQYLKHNFSEISDVYNLKK